MENDQRKWQNRPAGAATGLEDHLRNLMVADNRANGGIAGGPNAAAFPRLPSHHHSSPGREAPTPPSGPGPSSASPNYLSHGQPATSSGQSMPLPQKTSKRRPNQAQRRQMNSQFTFTPETPAPALRQNNPARPLPQHQQHAPACPLPLPLSWRRDLDAPPSQDSWRGASQFGSHPMQTTSGFPNRSPVNQYSNPAAIPNAEFRRSTSISNQDQHRSYMRAQELVNQAAYLEMLCHQAVSLSEIAVDEIAQKEGFRQRIESISREVVSRYEQEQNQTSEFPPASVQLKCFGSLSSGFATKDSDLDLGLLSPMSAGQPDAPGSPIPRLLEKAFLDAGLGARLLSRTRVPIIKLCESPSDALRKGLLEARAKWEAESGREASGSVEDEHCDGPPYADDEEHHQQDLTSVSADLTPPGDFEVPCRDPGQVQHFQLQQTSKQSFTSYCGLAKRVLRRAGGRDVNISNYRDLSEVEWIILSRVCQAFVRGLNDSRLQERIASHPFVSSQGKQDNNHRCSLSGLMTQVEGEKILQAWKDWPQRPLFESSIAQSENPSRLWKKSQPSPAFEIDPIAFSKDLQLTLERVKRITPIQLLLLEQGEEETPSQYYVRTKGIINQLQFDRNRHAEVHCVIIDCYVSGIRPGDVRDAVANYMSSFSTQSVFQAVGCRHQSLSLARDLERALGKTSYSTHQTETIVRYIDILRSPLVQSSADFVVPLPPGSSSLMATIKKMEDPRGLLPGQANSRFRDPLEFPKTGVGVQCDINFSAHLALHNTALLRCYAHTDPRVRPMVLFVKHWAKLRGINSGYRGTLSSYGYVLMVLHYLVNIVQPFVCPNLQRLAPKSQPNMSPAEIEATTMCRGYNVQFWRNEQEIVQLAMSNQLNSNTNSIGELLRGFFEYYAQSGPMSSAPMRGFDWGRDVLSLRTHGGLLTKQEKGWTGAKTVYADQQKPADASPSGVGQGPGGSQPAAATGNENRAKTEQSAGKGPVKEIRLRYLFAIEDPFELDHNVARTVTHNGIVAIRDEFRRAWRILRAIANRSSAENMLQDVDDANQSTKDFLKLLTDIHGSLE